MIYVLEIIHSMHDDYGHSEYTEFPEIYWEDESLAFESASRIRRNKSHQSIDAPIRYDELWNKVFISLNASYNGMFETLDSVTVKDFDSVEDFVSYMNKNEIYGRKKLTYMIKSPKEINGGEQIWNNSIKEIYKSDDN
jgi:hypothetical protein